VKLVAFDLETTGLDRHRDRIIEFSFVELDPDLNERGRWSRLVDPGIPIPAEIEALTGIRNDMVRGLPPFVAHAPRIQSLVKDAVLVAHNYAFDLPFLHEALRAAGQPGLRADHPCIDTLVIERYVNSNRLADTYKRYTGQAPDAGHRSEADVLATVEVLRRQRERHKDVLPGGGLDDLLYTRIDGHFGGDKRVRHWLDHDHKFYRDAEGTIRFGFGQHRGCPAVQVHPCSMGGVGHHQEFLRWMLRRDFPPETKATVEMILRAGPPAPAAGAQALPPPGPPEAPPAGSPPPQAPGPTPPSAA
jgi:DNA polymerase-3 subunit epsilon